VQEKEEEEVMTSQEKTSRKLSNNVRSLTSYVQSKAKVYRSRRSVGCNCRRRIEAHYIIRVCIHIIALNGQCEEKYGEEQEAQLTVPVATSSFRFSFAWRSHNLLMLVACSFAILIIHLMFFILFILLKLCECVSVAPLFLLPFFALSRHKTTLYFSPLFYSLFYLLFETATSGRFFQVCVYYAFFCKSGGTEEAARKFFYSRITN
jgi:hypothetical protein